MLGRKLEWAEKFEVLRNGGKICLPEWGDSEFFRINDFGSLVNQMNNSVYADILFSELNWYLWKPNYEDEE